MKPEQFYTKTYLVDKNLDEIKNKPLVVHFRFENHLDLLKIAEPHTKNILSSAGFRTDKNKWSGSASMQEAIQIAQYGWKDGLAAYRDIVQKSKITFDDIIPKQDYGAELSASDEGEIVDMEKFNQGDPEHMIKFTETKLSKLKTGRKIQRLVLNSVVNWNISAETFFNAGVVYQELINQLELAGFATEVWSRCALGECFDRSTPIIIIDTCCKSFAEITDIDKLLFFTAHPSLLRRFYFSICEKSPEETQRKLTTSYGSALEYSNDLIKEFGNDGTIFLPSLQTNLPLDQILAVVREMVTRRFNIEEYPDNFAM